MSSWVTDSTGTHYNLDQVIFAYPVEDTPGVWHIHLQLPQNETADTIVLDVTSYSSKDECIEAIEALT